MTVVRTPWTLSIIQIIPIVPFLAVPLGAMVMKQAFEIFLTMKKRKNTYISIYPQNSTTDISLQSHYRSPEDNEGKINK